MATLRIESTRPILTAQSTRAQVNITSKRRGFKVNRTPPRMTAKRIAPQMKVNWKKTRAQMGLRSPDYMRQYSVSRGRQHVRTYTQRVVSEGDQLGSVENYVNSGTEPLAEMQIQRMEAQQVQTNVASVPQESPEISWTPGSLQVEWTQGELEIEWDADFMPEFDVTPYTLDIRLQGRPEVRITVDNDNVQTFVGKKVNKKV